MELVSIINRISEFILDHITITGILTAVGTILLLEYKHKREKDLFIWTKTQERKEVESQRIGSIKLDPTQNKILEICKNSGHNIFEAFFHEDGATIRSKNDKNIALYECDEETDLEELLRTMAAYGYIKIIPDTEDFIVFSIVE